MKASTNKPDIFQPQQDDNQEKKKTETSCQKEVCYRSACVILQNLHLYFVASREWLRRHWARLKVSSYLRRWASGDIVEAMSTFVHRRWPMRNNESMNGPLGTTFFQKNQFVTDRLSIIFKKNQIKKKETKLVPNYNPINN